jgi:hypothetical protein
MVKKVAKIIQGRIRPSDDQIRWINASEEEYVIIQDDENSKGQKFLGVYIPTTKEDLALVDQYKNSQ